MIFNSIEFLIFCLIFFSLWLVFKKNKYTRWTLIVVSSFVFYGWWDWRFLFLIIGSGLIDYLAGLAMLKWRKLKTPLFILSLFGNLGSLIVFKYATFLAQQIERCVASLGGTIDLQNQIPEFALILPVGISFYTFQSMSYSIDVYRGRLTPTKNILHFFSYLAMFPQLVAGPIVRAKDFLKQLNRNQTVSSLMVWNGLKLISYGFFQKMVIADNLSNFIDAAHSGSSMYDGTLYWWVVNIAFAFQIYFDFSGYSLIARGLAKLMGYHFKMNFNHPYLASSFKMFWNRWHISLSSWFRDYVYIPIGGSKKGRIIGAWALSITFLLSGLWHGANFTFMVWAALHVVFLLSERLFNAVFKLKVPFLLAQPTVFLLTTLSWVYFRVESLVLGHEIVSKMLNYTPTNLSFLSTYENNLFFLKLALIVEFFALLGRRVKVFKYTYFKYNMDVVVVALSALSVLFLRGEGAQFIYFQF